MKKLNMTKTLALLGALCIGTSCFVGSTLAKYTTKGEANDSARVAKFGVTVTASATPGDAMFQEVYNDNSGNAKVQSTVKVVAPGTNGKLGAFTINGTPEVAVDVGCTVTAALTGNWAGSSTSGDFYCPIVISDGTHTFDGSTYSSQATFESELANFFTTNVIAKSYAPGTNLSGLDPSPLPNLTWSWPFEEGADDNAKATRNARDTYLADPANWGTEEANKPEITFTVTASVTQRADGVTP